MDGAVPANEFRIFRNTHIYQKYISFSIHAVRIYIGGSAGLGSDCLGSAFPPPRSRISFYPPGRDRNSHDFRKHTPPLPTCSFQPTRLVKPQATLLNYWWYCAYATHAPGDILDCPAPLVCHHRNTSSIPYQHDVLVK